MAASPNNTPQSEVWEIWNEIKNDIKDRFWRSLVFRTLANFAYEIDFGILLTGIRGMGKSTLGWKIAEFLTDILAPYFEVESIYVGPTTKNLIGFLSYIKRYEDKENFLPIFIFDESRLLWEKRRASSHRNVVCSELFAIIRPLKAVHIFICQQISDIDKDWRTPDRVKWFAFLHKRGRGYCWVDIHKNIYRTVSYLFSRWKIFRNFVELKGSFMDVYVQAGGIKVKTPNGYNYLLRLLPYCSIKGHPPSPDFEVTAFVGDDNKPKRMTYSLYRKKYRKKMISSFIDRMIDKLRRAEW